MKIEKFNVEVDAVVMSPPTDHLWMANLIITYRLIGAFRWYVHERRITFNVANIHCNPDFGAAVLRGFNQHVAEISKDMKVKELILVSVEMFDSIDSVAKQIEDRYNINKNILKKYDKEEPVDPDDFGSLAMRLPCAKTRVVHPVHSRLAPLWVVVIDLNDGFKWTREQIADWLDNLHESGTLDLSFAGKSSEKFVKQEEES
jgi:hypothetical protein